MLAGLTVCGEGCYCCAERIGMAMLAGGTWSEALGAEGCGPELCFESSCLGGTGGAINLGEGCAGGF